MFLLGFSVFAPSKFQQPIAFLAILMKNFEVKLKTNTDETSYFQTFAVSKYVQHIFPMWVS